MAETTIQWTDKVWNPVRGCTRVSGGCRNCYAERQAVRFPWGAPYAKSTAAGPRWTGRVELIPSKLGEPLRWRTPARVFVNSMSDLFHEALSDGAIDSVFAVMAHAMGRGHTFQVLTKRAERMRRYFAAEDLYDRWLTAINPVRGRWSGLPIGPGLSDPRRFPLPNVWLGVSVEDQPTADERVPLLLQTPAAVRFVSYEPALGPVNFESLLCRWRAAETVGVRIGGRHEWPGLDWVIVGGESGPGARPFDLAWARSVVRQCREARVACFVKQLGARVACDLSEANTSWFLPALLGHSIRDRRASVKLKHPKGGAMEEWPGDLRVREFPHA